MSPDDCQSVLGLWRSCAGIGLSAADEPDGITSYLQRNPGLSFVVTQYGRIVGAVLAGHDGRRGFLHHLAVASDYRRKGLGTELVKQALAGLAQTGIDKVHIFVYGSNQSGLDFWEGLGFVRRSDLAMMSIAMQ